MVIWLRGDAGPLGVDTDVVRREDLAQVLDLDAAWEALERRADNLLAQAE